jgi:hypothetical protein
MRDACTAALAVVMVGACGGALGAQNGGSESTAMFRGGPAHTGVYDRAVSGRALLGLRWRFVTEGDVTRPRAAS